MKTLKQKRDAPWKTVTAAAAEMNNVVSQIETKLVEIKTMRSQAEAVGGRLRDPQEYISELNKVKAEAVKVTADIHIKCDKIVKANVQVANILREPPETQLRWYTANMGQWERYKPEITVAIQKLNSLAARADLPRGAMENQAVAAAAAQLKKAAEDGVNECQAALVAGTQLQGKIQTQSQRAQQAATGGR